MPADLIDDAEFHQQIVGELVEDCRQGKVDRQEYDRFMAAKNEPRLRATAASR